MGILNVTPDSFSDGGLYLDPQKALARAKQIIDEGGDIIDIGGESTRPGSEPVGESEELSRVIPVIKLIRQHLGKKGLISIDTYKSGVAEQAILAGANIINDISAFSDSTMAGVAAKYQVPIILSCTEKSQKDLKSILKFLKDKIRYALQNSIKKDKIIIDPGIGFGKAVELNIEIINKLGEFKKLGLPVAIGISRKSFLGKDLLPTERLDKCLEMTAIAIANGADIIRTHDVHETQVISSDPSAAVEISNTA